nr:DNA cytosine methyltransferase [Rhizobium sp. Khangiran2]
MKFVEMFAGAGGMGLGFEAAGFEHLLSFELDEAAHDVLVNSGKEALRVDLNDVAATAFALDEWPDLIIGGPPCQEFSKAGTRKIGDRAKLTPIFAMTVCVMRPQWFVFENVDRAPFSRPYQHARELWKRAGYGLTEVFESASLHGVPQSRTRFFCIGRLGERDGFLESAIRDARSPKPMTVREMLNPRRYPEDAALLDTGYFWTRPWSGKSGQVGGRGVRSIDETCPTIIRTTHEGPGPSYVAHPDDAIPASQAHLLTLNQVARIQGFPHGYDFRGKAYKRASEGWSDRDVAQMIANAVPAPLARSIAQVIYDREAGRTIPEIDPRFRDWLKRKKPSLTDPSVANILSRLNRARRILHGRIYSDLATELAALESRQRFKEMSVRQKSDMRAVLRLYHEMPRSPGRFEWVIKRLSPQLFKLARPKPKKYRLKKGELPPVPRVWTMEELSMPIKLNAGGYNPRNEVAEDFTDEDILLLDRQPRPPRSDDDWRPEDYEDPDADDLATIFDND